MSFLKHFFIQLSHANVKYQLVTIYLMAVLIPITIISGVILTTFHTSAYHQYSDLVNSDNQRVKSILFNATTHLYNLSEELVSDTELQNLLEFSFSNNEKASQACSQYTHFNKILLNEPSVSSIRIYTQNSTIPNFYSFHQTDSVVEQSQWYQKASTSVSPFWQLGERKDSFGNVVSEATIYRHLTLVKSHSYAVLSLSLSNNYLNNQIENNTLCSLISINCGPVFYSTWPNLLAKIPPIPLDPHKFYQKVISEDTINQKKCLASVSTLLPYHTNDSFYILSLDSHAIQSMNHLLMALMGILLIIAAACCLIILLFTKYFSVRIESLRNAMRNACNNDYNIVDDFNGNDELADTFRNLQALIEQVKVKEAKMYSEQINEQKLLNEQQKMEYQILANQINPHFLYNTLETIRMKALTEGNRDVATAIKLLGKSMRYVLENAGTASTTLQKELDYISIYIQIQKLRFGNKFNYVLHLAPEINPEKCEILPLLLQPIIENSISHGFADITEGGLIDMNISLLGHSVLSITISDNGAGIPTNELSTLRHNILICKQMKSRHIGLYNINQRILLCYGECYGIKIDSEENCGTTVNLTIPYHTI
jgi:two-component system sensor histidine kinase YesM